MNKFLYVLTILMVFSCQEQTLQKITKKEDYNQYLTATPAKTTSKYFELWDGKIKPDSMQLMSFGIVAGQYSTYFQATGDISYLKKAEKALERAVTIAAIGESGYYRSLARNYISQHRFREAAEWASKARAKGSGVLESQSLLFDVHMELGNYDAAEKYLDSIKDMSSFGYLIRLAKWNDHKGDLKTTITYMEMALEKAEKSKNEDLRLWAYTNLADYYGHAGRIRDSYSFYLKALALDPQNAYAKKGIAWITFSYEKDPVEALRILDSVTAHYKAPDYYLLKSEIAAYMKDDAARLSNLDRYFKAVANSDYGAMYNAYNVTLMLDTTQQPEEALELANEEVQNRPTAHSYGLLAYAYFKLGDLDKALSITDEYITGKTSEPGVLLYAAEIYKADGRMEAVKELKTELAGAAYELGPTREVRIRNL